MLDFFQYQISSKVDTDFTQAMLNCYLKTHYDVIMEDETLIEKVEAIMRATDSSFNELDSLIDHNMCMVSHFTGLQMA